MSKNETVKIWREGAKGMKICGASLAKSLHQFPTTIFLSGELGAGKTTFIQGFAQGLGIRETITSPTYALEQRYKGIEVGLGLGNKKTVSLIHVDLYRLSKEEAIKLIESTENAEEIRCIEWAQRIEVENIESPFIDILIEEPRKDARELTITFGDLPFPSRDQIESWRHEVMLPEHICRHCDIVGSVAQSMAHTLLDDGCITRPFALRKTGELHDLLRFMDFLPDASPPGAEESEMEQQCWKRWKERYPHMQHEAACASFLREKGFNALGTIIEPHGLLFPSPPKNTIEQKILFYADKRVLIDRVVTLEERFEDFKKRYGKGKETPNHLEWFKEARAVEQELFPGGPPI